jgi:hypothetical protein
MTITWTKQDRKSFWNGSIGQDSYAQKFAFGISKAKPKNAYTRRQARMLNKKQPWAYVLHARRPDSLMNLVGTFETFEAAKQAAEQTLTA